MRNGSGTGRGRGLLYGFAAGEGKLGEHQKDRRHNYQGRLACRPLSDPRKKSTRETAVGRNTVLRDGYYDNSTARGGLALSFLSATERGITSEGKSLSQQALRKDRKDALTGPD